MTDAPAQVIVVGGGMAGLAAATRAVSQGAFVTLVEKDVLGGNSAKATSGVNGVLTKWQNQMIADGLIDDSVDRFVDDIMKAGHNKNKKEVVQVLVERSGPAVNALEDEFGLNVSDVQQLGGHTAKRTHRFPPKDGLIAPFGFTVVNTMKKKYLEYVEAGKAALKEKTRVTDIEMNDDKENPRVVSITMKDLVKDEETKMTNISAVIIASGGYAADSSEGSILAKARPDLVGCSTTNGDFATGDLVRIGQKLGLATIHLDAVQLHPSGFVDPKDPHAVRKFLCPEVMRGVGAILADSKGNRFVDELKPRDKVSEAILKHGGSAKDFGLSDIHDRQRMALMVISNQTAENFGMAAFNFYVYKGFIFNISDGALMKEHCPTIDMDTLQKTMESYDRACDGLQDDEFGKVTFPQKFGFKEGDTLYGCFVTPSLHFTMGGLEVDENARAIVDATRKSVANLYVAGETSGGIHGGNRLGGNGCLESLVFGRLSGELAAAQS
eukprot:Protomagalhaensia_sp_Gyna_25__378@NODE_117_length_5131_cov_535_123331_g91_i0_p1_GENE_NODE_117_length_5131_cov_535_123331_g91_i0NODE_117_length_5131_cov_535_123331_g91_i0_p1_ORF_typecomplete_len496_score121_02FAD_binding_2/PF00890_24/1_5e79FAD_oxidored/PF12831_7/5_1e13DAO/PF01266_24/6_7e13HI0933_like/PF03486_14/5e06HI0933_like/PF03486_14/0_28HI0933_like/PF03486_14/6_2e02Pyr_redox_2/PF07992_14/3_1e06Pyr_redox_2/PF07992_14/1_5Pyr_redox_2/PF07992_14/9_9GIDA/PF01134_22/1_9e07NAD_binding_8/PF13450_6/4